MIFEFATATRISFGWGLFKEVGEFAREFGKTALVVREVREGPGQALAERLEEQNIKAIPFKVEGEPTIDLVRAGVETAKENGCDFVISIGGGSAIDTGKAIAAMSTNPGDVLDYIEVIGAGKKIDAPPLPFIAIPTTAGTGAEVTRNAVLISPDHKTKASLRSPLMLPKLALIDPKLTLDLPPAVTANTGMDALVQVIEPFVSQRANPMIDALCRTGIQYGGQSLKRAFEKGDDATAREGMALTSLLGGLALANAGLGAVHGLAAAIGGLFDAPHGAICACLAAAVTEVNVVAVKSRRPDMTAVLDKFDEIARLLTGNGKAIARDGISWMENTCKELHIPPLADYRIGPGDFSAIIEKAKTTSSMKGNPVQLTSEELLEVLERSY